MPSSYLLSSLLLFLLTLFSVTHDFGNLAHGINPLQVSATAFGKAFLHLQKGKACNYNRLRKPAGSNWILGKERGKQRKWKATWEGTCTDTEQEMCSYAERGSCGPALHRAGHLHEQQHDGCEKGQIPLLHGACFIFFENRKMLRKLRALALYLISYIWFSLLTAAWNSCVRLFRIVSAI